MSNGADINFCDENGISHLYGVCRNGIDSTVQVLLSNGADMNSYDKDGTSSLYGAFYNRNVSTVQLKKKDRSGYSPSRAACYN